MRARDDCGMRRFIALAALPFALLPVAAGPAQAQSAGFSACLRAAGSNAVESTLCRQRELARQDRRLNELASESLYESDEDAEPEPAES